MFPTFSGSTISLSTRRPSELGRSMRAQLQGDRHRQTIDRRSVVLFAAIAARHGSTDSPSPLASSTVTDSKKERPGFPEPLVPTQAVTQPTPDTPPDSRSPSRT